MRVVLLLSVWFFVWGICPWSDSSASAAPYHAAHDRHGHSASDSHHASKGGEHGCSGSLSYKKSFECEQPAVSSDLPMATSVDLHVPAEFFGSAPDRPALYLILRN